MLCNLLLLCLGICFHEFKQRFFFQRDIQRANLALWGVHKAAIKNLPQMKMRADRSDGDSDYEENFYILRHTVCPAVLTENGFYTNQEDLAMLESREGRRAITDLHVEGIIEYLTK